MNLMSRKFHCLKSAIWIVAIMMLSAQADVEQWHPVDLSFTTSTSFANPFEDVTMDATFTGPGNVTLKIPGFYIGGNTWKVRFAPTQIGNWTYVTSSPDANLSNVSGSVNCVANTQANVHGRLAVDAANPHHFRFEDGTPYFLMGGEINWLALMQTSDATLTKPKQIIDMYAARGFTAINMNGYAWDTSWKTGKTSADDFGPPDIYAWAGTNASPDHSRLNTAYWDHYDKVIDYLYQKGMVAYIYFKVYNKLVNWPTKGSKDDSLYFATITARYQAYPNIIWSFSKESYNEPDDAYIHRMLNLITAKDAYKRLRTTHDDLGKGHDYAGDPALNTNMDFRTDQQQSAQYSTVIGQRNQKNWPIYNAELGYEIGNDGGHTYSSVQSKEQVLKWTYEVLMAGGYPAYYYTYHAWDVVKTYEVPNGLKFYGYLSSFFTQQTKWYDVVPNDNLLGNKTGNHCMAKAGSEYMVYLSNGGSTTLNIAGAASPVQGVWMNAYTGQQQSAGPFTNGSPNLTAPWSNVPSVLWLAASGTANISPTVSITAPANGASYTAPATITLAANAADQDGSVAKVEFYQGSTLLSTATTAPYGFSWANVAAGSYSLTAVATDNLGASTTSATVNVTVTSGGGGTVNLSLNGTATASSMQTTHVAVDAKDNSTTTRWCASNGTANQWLEIDLGADHGLTGTEIVFEKSWTYKYKIETSSDNAAWAQVVNKTANGTTAQTFADAFSATARYVRVTSTATDVNHWASIFEFRVLGPSAAAGAQARALEAAVSVNAAVVSETAIDPVLKIVGFNAAALSFNLPKAGYYTFSLFDITGAKVASLTRDGSAGINQISLQGKNLSHAIYFVKLRSNGRALTQTVRLVK